MNKNFFKKFIGALALTSIPLLPLIVTEKIQAKIPQKAVIINILGKRELWVNIGGRRAPAQEGSTLQKYRDSLLVNGNNNTHSILKFFSDTDEDLDLFVKTILHPEAAIYNFPCDLRGGTFLFGWKLAANKTRACEKALQIKKGAVNVSKNNNVSDNFLVRSLKQIFLSQTSTKQIFYCTVETKSGESWLDIKRGEPCKKISEECLKQNSKTECTPMTMGSWWTTDEKLTATLECADRELFTAESNGTNIEQTAKQLWQQAIDKKAKFCGLQIYAPEDLTVLPASDKEVLSTGDREIWVLSKETGDCTEIKVLKGAVIVKSATRPEGTLVKSGYQSTSYFCQKTEG